MKHFEQQSIDLMCGDDLNFKCDVATTFVNMVSKDVELLEQARAKKDSDLLKFKAHKLKSSLDFVGAKKLAKLAKAIEECSTNIGSIVLEQDINTFIMNLKEAIIEMEELRESVKKKLN